MLSLLPPEVSLLGPACSHGVLSGAYTSQAFPGSSQVLSWSTAAPDSLQPAVWGVGWSCDFSEGSGSSFKLSGYWPIPVPHSRRTGVPSSCVLAGFFPHSGSLPAFALSSERLPSVPCHVTLFKTWQFVSCRPIRKSLSLVV